VPPGGRGRTDPCSSVAPSREEGRFEAIAVLSCRHAQEFQEAAEADGDLTTEQVRPGERSIAVDEQRDDARLG